MMRGAEGSFEDKIVCAQLGAVLLSRAAAFYRLLARQGLEDSERLLAAADILEAASIGVEIDPFGEIDGSPWYLVGAKLLREVADYFRLQGEALDEMVGYAELFSAAAVRLEDDPGVVVDRLFMDRVLKSGWWSGRC